VRISIGVITLAAILGFAFCPKSPDSSKANPEQILRKAISSQGKLSYRAVQKHSYNVYGSLHTSSITVKSGRGHSQYLPVLRNYTPLIEGEDTVAGRKAWVLRLRPRDKYRPWKQLWVDKNSYIILASRDWSSRDSIKSTTITISISGISKNQHPIQHTSCRLSTSFRSINLKIPKYLPYGYKLQNIRKLPHENLTQIDYSDGLYTISLFERFPGTLAREKKQSIAVGDCRQGIVYFIRNRNFDLTIIADLPVTELRRIAASIQ
jgi:negative regulator of sigma E activity